jgi:hypothetical protein
MTLTDDKLQVMITRRVETGPRFLSEWVIFGWHASAQELGQRVTQKMDHQQVVNWMVQPARIMHQMRQPQRSDTLVQIAIE